MRREQFCDALPDVLFRRQTINLLTVIYKGHIQRGICQSDSCELFGDMTGFGICCFEEFSSGRQFIEEVSDLYCCAVICAGGGDGCFFTAINLDGIGGERIFCSAYGPDL